MSHFDRESITSFLGEYPELSRRLQVVDQTGSTNEDLKALALQGAPDWTILAAASQTAGKGSRGRSWSSPKGSSLSFSVLLRPRISPEEASMVTLVMALGIAEGLERVVDITYNGRSGQEVSVSTDAEMQPVVDIKQCKWSPQSVDITQDETSARKVDIIQTGSNRQQVDITQSCCEGQQANITQEFGIKWPNDIVHNKKKICGILTEMPAYTPDSCCIIIGAGINVNMESFPEELQDKATSLKLEFGRPFDRGQVLAEVLKGFSDRYRTFLATADLSALREEYEKRLLNKGEEVRLLEDHSEITGLGLGINEKGELLVNAGGRLRCVRAGEVSVRGLYTYA